MSASTTPTTRADTSGSPQRVGNINLQCILGVGAFGRVFLGKDAKTQQDVAVKILDKKLITENDLKEYVDREIKIGLQLRHPHIVKLVNVIEDPKQYCLITELASGGELFDKIVESKRFPEPTARRYFQQLMSAVAYFHQFGIVHRDLKAENLLLDGKDNLKVCDFGLSRYTQEGSFSDNPVVFMSLAGSPDYQAPEVIDTKGYQGTQCDVWSCGVILYFMLCGHLPFTAKLDAETQRRILAGEYRRDHPCLPTGAADLLSHMLVPDPSRRYTTQQVLEHSWVRQGADPKLFSGISSPTRARSPVHPGSPSFEQTDEVTFPRILSAAFHSCNVVHDGHLTAFEVRDVLIKLNDCQPVPPEAVEAFMANFEREPDGSITESHFVEGWMSHRDALDVQYNASQLVNMFHYEVEGKLLADLRETFLRLDKECNGVIDAQELSMEPTLQLSLDEATQVIDAITARKGRGGATFEDFVTACTSADLLRRHPLGSRLQRLTDLFTAVDAYNGMRNLSSGFTVAGLREQITTKLLLQGPKDMSTTFELADNGYLYGTHTDAEDRVIIVGVFLRPAATGYTKVCAYRASGRTDVFLLWFPLLRRMLHDEIQRCVEDTTVASDPELI